MRHTWLVCILFMLTSSAFTATVEFPAKQVGKRHNLFLIVLIVQDRPRNFIVDTGSGITILDRTSFVDLPVLGDPVLANTLSGESRLDIVRAEFSVGDEHIQQEVFRSDMSGMSRSIGIKIDGVLGQDILSHFSSVTFDYKSRHVIFSK